MQWLGRGEWEGGECGESRVYILAYADSLPQVCGEPLKVHGAPVVECLHQVSSVRAKTQPHELNVCKIQTPESTHSKLKAAYGQCVANTNHVH